MNTETNTVSPDTQEDVFQFPDMDTLGLPEQAIKLIEASRRRPDLWIEKILDCALWKLQREIVQSVFTNPRTSVRSCTGSGKSYIAARIALAFLCNYKPSTVITTAPTFRQVESILWREIATAYGRAKFPLGGNLIATRLEMTENWFAMGLSTDEPERFQGFHSPYMLVIGDEASGLGDMVYAALETPLSTGHARLLLISNPTQPVGKFRDTFDSSLYRHFNISAFDTPNFIEFGITIDDIRTGAWKDKIGIARWQIADGSWLQKLPCPYLVTPLWVSERMEAWGEGSFLFQVYVMGNFPQKGVNNLFNLAEVESAINRKVNDEGTIVAAEDVARYGDCESVYGIRRGDRLVKLETWGHEGIHYTTGRTIRHLREDTPVVIHIDAGGIGADDCDIVAGEGFNVDRVLSNAPAVDKERFLNRRAELYWLLSKRFTDGNISIPEDRKLTSQLTDIRYTYKQGKMAMESKEEMRARGSKSPDRADMLSLLFSPETIEDNTAPPVWNTW